MTYYAVAVHVDGTDNNRNGIVFRTKEEAERSGNDLLFRWLLPTGFHVVEVSEEEFVNNKLALYTIKEGVLSRDNE